MTTRTTEPNDEFIDKIKDLVKDYEEFEEEGLSELLAYSCWRHDSPVKASVIEAEIANFSEPESDALSEWLDKTNAYFTSQATEEFIDDKPDDLTINLGERAMPEYTGGIANALGLGAGVSEGQVVRAIEALKSASFSETERNALLNIGKKQRILEFQEETTKLDVIPGTPVELAEKLYEMETAVSPAAATERLKEWQGMQAMIDTAGVTDTVLSANHSEDASTLGPAQAKIQQYAESNNVDMPVAVVHFANNDRQVFNAYRNEVNNR